MKNVYQIPNGEKLKEFVEEFKIESNIEYIEDNDMYSISLPLKGMEGVDCVIETYRNDKGKFLYIYDKMVYESSNILIVEEENQFYLTRKLPTDIENCNYYTVE